MVVAAPSARRKGEREAGNRIRLTARCDFLIPTSALTATRADVGSIEASAPFALLARRPGARRSSVRPDRSGRVRREGRQPEFPPPTIRDYKPRSTLVVPQHPVPRAKFPVIDIHSHQPTPISPAEFDRVVKAMDALNLQILVNLSGSSGDRLRQGVDALRASRYKDRMVLFANVNFREGVGPGFGAKAATQLEADIKAGALGLKIFKDLGLLARKADGTRLKVDDPELDPIWATCARLNVPGPHPHRRAGGVLPAARLHERALAGAVAVSRSPPPGRACASRS